MIKEFEYKGKWWLPEKPENKVNGILKFDPKSGIELELLGGFDEIDLYLLNHYLKLKNVIFLKKDINKVDKKFETNSENGIYHNNKKMKLLKFEPSSFEIILGLLSDGSKITLLKCFEKSKKLNLSGFNISKIIADKILLGEHFNSYEDIRFKSLVIYYPHLDEWVNKSGFNIKYKNKSNYIFVEYNLPESFKVNLKNDIDVLIDFQFESEVGVYPRNKVNISQNTSVKIKTLLMTKLEDLENIAYKIQSFLCFVMMTEVYPLFYIGQKNYDNEEKIIIYFKVPYYNGSEEIIHPDDFLINFDYISKNLDIYLNRWIENEEEFKLPFNLYFSSSYKKNYSIENIFLNLVQAFEIYHRKKYGGSYEQEEFYLSGLYKRFIEIIPNNITNDYKESIKGKLKYIFEFSLRKRLKDILEKNEDVISIIINNSYEFIEDVINTRNYLIHGDIDLENKSVHNRIYDLYLLCEKLKFIIQICFLLDLGIPRDDIKIFIFNNKNYKKLLKN